MAKFKPYFEVDISKDYSPEERRSIAAEIIDEIITRTENGKDKDGNKFVKYSKEYAKEKGQKNVDLTFSGEMLAEIVLLQERNGRIRIGFDKNYDGIGKVEGNILGTYGNSSPVNKGRDFLGMTQKEIKEILSNYPINDKQERKDRVDNIKTSSSIAESILFNSGLLDGEET